MKAFTLLTAATSATEALSKHLSATANQDVPREVSNRAPGECQDPQGWSTSLDRHWLFGGIYEKGSDQPDHDDGAFYQITLPHVVTPLSWNNFSWESWNHTWIYRRHFNVPQCGKTMRIFVEFDGVMSAAAPVINGAHLPPHLGGYLPFSYEITKYANEDNNVLAVKVDGGWLNVPPAGSPDGPDSIDYLQPGGIYRGVRLRMVPKNFIKDVYARPLNVLEPYRSLDIEISVDVSAPFEDFAYLTATLLDGERILNHNVTEPLLLDYIGTNTTYFRLPPGAPIEYWSPAHPKLYTLMVALYSSGRQIHTFNRTTGFREAVYKVDGFFLNGERLKIFGLDRHQHYPYGGMAAPKRLQRRDAEILKGLNCNMVRCSHYPQSPDFLDACDELGIMVWDETPGWQYIGDEAWQRQVVENVHDMVVRDRHHVSIIVWAVQVNESPRMPDLYAETRNVANGLDGTRQTSGAVGYFSEAPGEIRSLTNWVQDVFAYDDYHRIQENATLLEPLPMVPYLVSESVGGSGLPSDYRFFDNQTTQQFQAQAHAQVHDLANSRDNYAGALSWLAIDYASSFHGKFENIAWKGVTDMLRVQKPGAAFYQSQCDPSERALILPAFYWDFNPASSVRSLGEVATIWSNCDQLIAYLDDEHYQNLEPAVADYPNTRYPPFNLDLERLDHGSTPTLRLDGYVNGSLVATRSFSGGSEGDHLQIFADDTQLEADGIDATILKFRAVDRFSSPKQHFSGNVQIAIDGPATWVGVLASIDVNITKETSDGHRVLTATVSNGAFPFGKNGGVGGVMIRTIPGQTGPIVIHASHDELGEAQVQIDATSESLQAENPGPEGILNTSPSALTDVSMDIETSGTDIANGSARQVDDIQPGGKATAQFRLPSGITSEMGFLVIARFKIDGQPSQLTANVTTLV